MIAKGFLMEWQEIAPWNTQAMIEQDLIISRAVVEIFSHPLLAEHLAFRGGTALHNMEAKINLPEFRSDTEYLLRAEVEYPLDEAYRLFDKEVLSVLEKKEQK